MNVVVAPAPLSGEVRAPSSKSEAHRLLICAAFAPGTTDIDCTTTSADIEATVRCLEALGARVARKLNPMLLRALIVTLGLVAFWRIVSL